MTGYGKAADQWNSKKITVEIKSLNSKNFDLNVRMPSQYKEKEMELRKMLSKQITRGKVDFSIYVEQLLEVSTAKINPSVVNSYIEDLKAVGGQSEDEMLSIAMRLPDVLKVTREEFNEQEWSAVHEIVEQALIPFSAFRRSEGEAMTQDLRSNIETIDRLLQEVKDMAEDRIVHVKNKLQQALDDLKQEVDQNRFEQELIFYLEKYDINEEVVRLENHLSYFMEELESNSSNGKKLGFIAQEIGREINTTGSKSNFAPMQRIVVQMKNELEKIKEQILNIL